MTDEYDTDHEAVPLLGEESDDEAVDSPSYGGGRRRGRRRRSIPGCLAVIVALAVIVGGFYFGVTWGIGKISDQFSSADDYPGPGTGSVSFQVEKGDTVAVMGRNLKAEGVVASVQAFIDAAKASPDSNRIQAGYFPLKKEMAASDVVEILVDPSNLQKASVTIPEGFRVGQIVTRIVKQTDFTQRQLTALLAKPAKIGLPAEADGNPEGYLFPATYEITPDLTARELLSQMVAKTAEVEKSLDLASGSAALGLSPHEVMTVASILEYEANSAEDYAKVARVIYNRLDADMALQLDSTVSYVSKRKGDVWTTSAERESDSAYNTYKHTGLPPGPIGSPGEESIKAALNPPEGDWLYFVPDFESGTTLFTSSYSEHLRNVQKAKDYCKTHDSC